MYVMNDSHIITTYLFNIVKNNSHDVFFMHEAYLLLLLTYILNMQHALL